MRGSFNKGQSVLVFSEHVERGFRWLFRGIGRLFERSLTGPFFFLRVTVNHREVFFHDLSFFESLPDFTGCDAVGCEENDSRSWLIESMNDMNFLFDLISKNFHRNEIVGPGFIGSVDQNTGRFVDRDKPLVPVKNRERGHFGAGGSKREMSLGCEVTSASE